MLSTFATKRLVTVAAAATAIQLSYSALLPHVMAEQVSYSTSSQGLSPNRQDLVDDVLKLYQGKASADTFKHFTQDTTQVSLKCFEDPISIAKGLEAVKSQWYGLPKVFCKSTTESMKVLKNDPNEIQLDLNTNYVIAYTGKDVLMNSLCILKLDADEKVTYHADWWNHKPFKAEGITGKTGKFLREMNAKMIELFVSAAKGDKERHSQPVQRPDKAEL